MDTPNTTTPQQPTKKPPVINCHTHIFTGDSVPPFLAKTYLPWPLYYLLPVSWLVSFFRFWYKHPDKWRYKPFFRKLKEVLYKIKMFITRTGILYVLVFLIGVFLCIQVFFILFDRFSAVSPPGDSVQAWVTAKRLWLGNHWLILIPESLSLQILMVLAFFLFYKAGRNLLWMVLKKIWSFLGILPGPKTKELAGRYLNIGRFAFYQKQRRIFGRLKGQYPNDTGFVVLPMDMEYMGAGKLNKQHRYLQQMEELAKIKSAKETADIFYPFVFAEPRRIAAEGTAHFDYEIGEEKGKKIVVLKDCFIKKYIVEHKFSGFKIYPALGYYPFDEKLLPLWKYAADNNIPILTHCIRGTIYYRGRKKADWDYHQIITRENGERFLLPQTKNVDFMNNFTHPLNFLCLLEEQLLRKWVGKAKDQKVRDLFGYTDDVTELTSNLSHLKICFGHFGGDDEWDRFLELDRDNYSGELLNYPEHGIHFFTAPGKPDEPKKGKLAELWTAGDWYSIICSMMLQHPNVYADLSYIIHNRGIEPLLKQTLQNPGLRTKVLFGTDFYVVRNHKTEKNMLADITDYLCEDDFDMIARKNPREFLKNLIHGPVKI